jgi:polyferredoxin
MSLDPETKRWLKDWGVKIGATAYLLFVFAFMASHPQPGSIASLSQAVTLAILPAAIATLAVLGLMLYLRSR